LFDRLIKIMGENPKLIPKATYLMWCGHNLERIADRVTNLAEQVNFMTTGQMKELGG
jgi:phosphate transport system protein